MPLLINSIGTATPRHVVEQPDAAEIAKCFVYDNHRQHAVLASLFRRTKVRERHSVLLERPKGEEPRQSFYPRAATMDDRGPTTQSRLRRYAEHAPQLAIDAATDAMKRADLSPEQVTQLITVTCTGFVSPGIDMSLVKQLGLSPWVGRTQVGFMGCHGALNGLRVAQAFVEADPRACVLMCAVELCSLHYQYGWDADRLVSNALFADGAAALTATAENGSQPSSWRVTSCNSCLMPHSEDAMTWQIGDHGFEMTLSSRVPDLIEQHLRPWLCEWLAANGHGLSEIGSWAVHPGGPRILTSVAAALDLPPETMDLSQEVLATHGNMSSPTVLFILQRLQELNAPLPCVALAFGPGLVAEAVLVA